MSSKNTYRKKLIANSVFTGIIVMLIVLAVVIIVKLNLSDALSYGEGSWRQLPDSKVFGSEGSLIRVYPEPYSAEENKLADKVSLKGIFTETSGRITALLLLPDGIVSLSAGDSVSGVTLESIVDGLVTLSVQGEKAYLTLDNPDFTVKK